LKPLITSPTLLDDIIPSNCPREYAEIIRWCCHPDLKQRAFDLYDIGDRFTDMMKSFLGPIMVKEHRRALRLIAFIQSINHPHPHRVEVFHRLHIGEYWYLHFDEPYGHEMYPDDDDDEEGDDEGDIKDDIDGDDGSDDNDTSKETVASAATTTTSIGSDGKVGMVMTTTSVHRGVTCDGCHRGSPLYGHRWKCQQCPDFDYCGTCYANGQHTPGHTFVQIKGSTLAKPVSVPLPPSAKSGP
jgi:hypothetical protein